MTYQRDCAIALGAGQTGLTLTAQLVDTVGANVGAVISTGFVEIGVGNYLWHYAAYPDGFRGGVVFLSGATVKAFTSVNPEEAENVDAKVTSRATVAGVLDEASVACAGKPDTLRKLIWFVRQMFVNKLTYDKATDHMRVYEDDGTTAKLDHAMTDDVSVAQREASS